MKTIKITTNANCQGKYEEAVLAQGNISTVLGFKRLINKALENFQKYKRYSPNYPLYIVIDGKRIQDDMIFSLATTDAEFKDIADREIAEFLKI